MPPGCVAEMPWKPCICRAHSAVARRRVQERAGPLIPACAQGVARIRGPEGGSAPGLTSKGSEKMTFPAQFPAAADGDADPGLREMARIHGLTDRFLGQYVLDLARKMRVENPGVIGVTGRWQNYESWISWEVVPEIARRLGVIAFGKNEGSDKSLPGADRSQLRRMLGVALLEANFLRDLPWPECAPSCRLAARCATIGNPFVIALDRAAPPSEDRHERFDFLAMRLRAALAGKGKARRSAWAPELVGATAMAAPLASAAEAAEIIPLAPVLPQDGDPMAILGSILMDADRADDDPSHVLRAMEARRAAEHARVARRAGSGNAFADDFPDGFIDLPI